MNVLVGIHPRLVDPALVQGVLDGEGAGLDGLFHLFLAGPLLSAGRQGQGQRRGQPEGDQPPSGNVFHHHDLLAASAAELEQEAL